MGLLHGLLDKPASKTMPRIQLITDYGIANADAIVHAAEQPDRPTLARCLAMIENESGGRNIFGAEGQACPPEWYEQDVTQSRYTTYKQRREHFYISGITQDVCNGVGPTQLTDRALQIQAERRGGCWIPLHNCETGFALLHQLITQLGPGPGARHYNGGTSINSQDESYEARFLEREAIWNARLKPLRLN